jgi:phthiocerol/phenolphthiocerol synthesis type-I polyketide synthase E
MTTPTRSLDIAIVSMAGRFPGASGVDALWANLCAGVESVATLGDAELLAAGVAPELLRQSSYVRARALLPDIELFDAELFGYGPAEAAAIDPQQRLFLECAFEAFERAGHDPERASARVGVFAGSSFNGYLFRALPDGLLQSSADLSSLLGLDKDFLTTRVSYKLNLTGPSVAVQTACSTSLVAVHLACQALLNGECELALAGGVCIGVPQHVGYSWQEGGIASPDGHCRPFDAQAQGTVAGSGVGVVLLKRLEDALLDRDPVVAVIKGSAINNDGRGKLGFTAPGVAGQVRVIREALAMAEVAPDTIGYVEAHGTATPLGDPVEVAALTEAFQPAGPRGSCGLGSLKGNLGHLDAAAGVAGLIKAALALSHRQLPPSLHFREPNPAIDFARGPFRVIAELEDWQAAGPRRAGVSSFGLGGTNAHVVLEEAPAPIAAPARGAELVVLSARSAPGLEQLRAELAAQLERQPELGLSAVAYTLQRGRRAQPYRWAAVASDRAELLVALRSPARPAQPVHARRVAFLFPGQGVARPDWARPLYEQEPVFREEIDRCAAQLRSEQGFDLLGLCFPPAPHAVAAARRLAETDAEQLVLFTLELALARLWMAWGVQPSALLGHSLGEWVAACLAGCISQEQALRLVSLRGRSMRSAPEGGLLAVAASEAELAPLLQGELELAAVNGPRQCVLSGSVAALQRCRQRLSAAPSSTRRSISAISCARRCALPMPPASWRRRATGWCWRSVRGRPSAACTSRSRAPRRVAPSSPRCPRCRKRARAIGALCWARSGGCGRPAPAAILQGSGARLRRSGWRCPRRPSSASVTGCRSERALRTPLRRAASLPSSRRPRRWRCPAGSAAAGPPPRRARCSGCCSRGQSRARNRSC